MNQSVQHWRQDTPGISGHVHLNNAGAALPPEAVLRACTTYLQREAQVGGYELAADCQEEIARFYERTARLLNAKPRNIAFATNASDAYNRALISIPFEPGDCIVTSRNDYVSNQLAFLQLRDRFGVQIHFAADLPTGGVDPDAVIRMVRQYQPRLVAITEIPTNSGLIQDVYRIGDFLRKQHNTLYLVDACQSAGQIPIDVQRMGCDFLSATGRKFLRGPRGTGFLYVADRVLSTSLAPLFVDLRSAYWTAPNAYQLREDARRFELWERPYALLLGLSEAIAYASAIGLDQIQRRNQYLSQLLRNEIQQVPHLQLADQGERQCAIVTFHHPEMTATACKQRFDQAGVAGSLSHQEGARYDMPARGLPWVMRLSPHYYNTEEEIAVAIDVLRDL